MVYDFVSSGKMLEEQGASAPSRRDSGGIVGIVNPRLKRGACAYGAGD